MQEDASKEHGFAWGMNDRHFDGQSYQIIILCLVSNMQHQSSTV